MDQITLASGFGFSIFLVVANLYIRGRVRENARTYSRRKANSDTTGYQLVRRIVGGEGLPEVEVWKRPTPSGGGSFSDHGVITIPEPDGNSLFGLVVAAHEVAHLRQREGIYSSLIFHGKYLEVAGSLVSYLIPVSLVLGVIFYPLLIYLAAVLFCVLAVLVVLEAFIEVDASRRATGYLKEYTDVGEEDLGQVKKILFWAILSRISYFTGGYLALFIMDEAR